MAYTGATERGVCVCGRGEGGGNGGKGRWGVGGGGTERERGSSGKLGDPGACSQICEI